MWARWGHTQVGEGSGSGSFPASEVHVTRLHSHPTSTLYMGLILHMAVQIGYVKGIDLSPGEIEEARRRYEEYVGRRRPNESGT